MRMRDGVAPALALALALGGCVANPSKPDEEAVRNTFACLYKGERLVVRFESDEARLLMPEGDRVTLYQIPAASGVRYSNGVLELRGKGMELQLVRDGASVPLTGCEPYVVPK
jgi:membrane-bound inhibitor of C-type lysozyme